MPRTRAGILEVHTTHLGLMLGFHVDWGSRAATLKEMYDPDPLAQCGRCFLNATVVLDLILNDWRRMYMLKQQLCCANKRQGQKELARASHLAYLQTRELCQPGALADKMLPLPDTFPLL